MSFKQNMIRPHIGNVEQTTLAQHKVSAPSARDDWVQMQVKTYTAWVSHRLSSTTKKKYHHYLVKFFFTPYPLASDGEEDRNQQEAKNGEKSARTVSEESQRLIWLSFFLCLSMSSLLFGEDHAWNYLSTPLTPAMIQPFPLFYIFFVGLG